MADLQDHIRKSTALAFETSVEELIRRRIEDPEIRRARAAGLYACIVDLNYTNREAAAVFSTGYGTAQLARRSISQSLLVDPDLMRRVKWLRGFIDNHPDASPRPRPDLFPVGDFVEWIQGSGFMMGRILAIVAPGDDLFAFLSDVGLKLNVSKTTVRVARVFYRYIIQCTDENGVPIRGKYGTPRVHNVRRLDTKSQEKIKAMVAKAKKANPRRKKAS